MCAFEAPVDDYDPDKSFDSPPAGRYHVAIVRVDEDGGKRGEMIVDMEVLAGTVANQEGQQHREYFSKSMKSIGKIHALAVSIGLITKDEIRRHKAAGTSPSYDFAGAGVGRQLMVELTEEEYPEGSGKRRRKANFALYHPAEERVRSWPKNPGWLARAGIVIPAGNPAASSPVSPAASASARPASNVADDLLNGVV